MKFKYKITADEFNALSETEKVFYSEKDDGYLIDIEGLPQAPDVGPLERAKARLGQDNKELKAQLAAIQGENETLKEQLNEARISPENLKDLRKITDAHKAQLAEKDAELASAKGAHRAEVRRLMVEHAASSFAAGTKAPRLVGMYAQSRLDVDFEGETPQVYVKDAEGKKTALTLDEFRAEMAKDAEFSELLNPNRAQGSAGLVTTGRAPLTGDAPPPVRLSELSPRELAIATAIPSGKTGGSGGI